MIRALLVIVAALAAASVAAQETSGVFRAAISEDTTLTTAEAQAGTGPTRGSTVTLPAWDMGEERYVYVGVPAAHDDITGMMAGPFPIFAAFEVAVPQEVDGYQWWRTIEAQRAMDFRVTYTVRQ